MKLPASHDFMSFDVESLLMNVRLDYIINIMLGRIYEYNKLYTNISKKEMKELLLLYTKKCAFYF